MQQLHTLQMEVVKRMKFYILVNIWLCCYFFCISHASDSLRPGHPLGINQTLVSPGGVFELGFFNFSYKYYLGIWLKNDKYKKAVWVAHPEKPMVGNPVLYVSEEDGNLMMSDQRGVPRAVNEGAFTKDANTTVTLLDTGNLVLYEGNITVWQSFDHPTDTFLPGMKLGSFNLNTDHPREQFLESWLTPLDPSKGNFVLGLESENKTRFDVWRTNIKPAYQEIGHWDGTRFKMFFDTSPRKYNFSFVSNYKEAYLTFSSNENGTFSWFEQASNGEINELTLVGNDIKIQNHSLCHDTMMRNSSGCLSMMPSLCRDGDKFSEIKGLLPNSMRVYMTVRMVPHDCELICKSDCSCTAYAPFYNDKNNCQIYYGNKSDLQIPSRGNNTIYVRGGLSSQSSSSDGSDHKRISELLSAILIPVLSLMLLIMILYFCCSKKRKLIRIGIDTSQGGTGEKLLAIFWGKQKYGNPNERELSRENKELPMLSFSSISAATGNFSLANKLGEGGFGPVFKGILPGVEVAVKRLSKHSGQGVEEFRTEIQLISELQHRNLVKLLGCCIHGEEMILVYEYMPNRSLDSFIFDSRKRTLLDWGQRKLIIEGTAQGLLYLHKYSRVRIIHRDLKTSNILLDAYMNPKISDFGMARIFNENESQAVTKRVVGTYGYMSPEYAIHGHFSTKSDIFSYGVILLEIVSGQRNTSIFEYSGCALNLIGYAWNLWNDDKAWELLDPTVVNSCTMSELLLCIQVGLLCVQENPEDRPSMSDVASMLGNERTVLPSPKQPALSTYLNVGDIDSPKIEQNKPSQANVTMSAVHAR